MVIWYIGSFEYGRVIEVVRISIIEKNICVLDFGFKLCYYDFRKGKIIDGTKEVCR